MMRASGCRVWDEDGREYVDYVMALGAVALGYGHPAVNRAAEAAIAAGVVGPLPPVSEEQLAEALAERIPWMERIRFLKTGAEAVAAAVRLAIGGVVERYNVRPVPDLVVVGKALGNGFPLAAVGGRAELMEAASRTWISSTLATEGVSLAAARATLEVFEREDVCAHLHRAGTTLLHGLHELQRSYGGVISAVAGIAEMCFLHYSTEEQAHAVALAAAKRGVLFKRTAYNFVSLAHDERTISETLDVLDQVLRNLGG